MNRSFQRFTPPDRQRGVVLFVGLVMLLLLTLIGIAAMLVTVLQERMAGNFYVQNLGFEDGEAVLATGRNTVRSNPSNYGFDCRSAGTCLTLGTGDTLPWDAWVTGEPTLPSPPDISLLYSWQYDARSGNTTITHYYSVAAVGGDASGDAKTALQGIYIF